MLTSGDTAPTFSLASTDNKPVSLDSITDKGPALVVFVSEECPTSRLAVERLESLREPFEQAGASLVAVFEDDSEVAARTMRRCQATYQALSEPAPFEVSESYGIQTVPSAFLVGTDGRVIDAIEGWSREDYNRVAAKVAELDGNATAGQVSDENPHEKPGCSSKNTLDPSLIAAMSTDAGFDEWEDMFERGWSDGLPTVPPTRERVRRMLGGRDPSRSLGPVPPGMGELTLERLSACAVLAGCHHSYFPLVLAATEAVLDPAYNVHGSTNSTHTSGPVLIVNGPVRKTIEVNCGINSMGGWSRANATIGRAIRLVIGLTGQGRPGTLDRSTFGQPGKISFCFGENEEDSPWGPLSEDRGFGPGQSVVTAYCGDAPFSFSDHYSRDPKDIITTISLAGCATFSPHVFPIGAETVFVLSPEHARDLAAAGWSKKDVAQRIFDASKRKVGDLRGGEQSMLAAGADDDTELTKWLSPDEVVIVVSGGRAGRFSAVLPPWVGFGLGSQMVSRAVTEQP